MQRLSNKDPDQINNADSFATMFGSGSSQCYSPKQPQFSLSMSKATELKSTAEHSYPIKLVEPMYQEQDSSSTLSTGQSHREAAAFARSNFPMQNASFKHGLFETCKKRGDDYARPALPHGNEDCITLQVQMEHNQSSAGMSYPFDGPYFGRITAAYEPYAAVCPQMMGMAPARIVLPLDCTEGAPIFVNAKQYHAIIRRRQSRAKLEAQNKVGRSRKPYLHESRHLHALKRARGSGGRFLNTKNMEKPKPSNQTHMKNLSLLQLNRDASELKIQHSENNSWGASNTSGSNASCILRNDEIFQQPDLRGSISALSIGATAHIGAHSRVLAPSDDRLMLTVDRRAHISTVT